jgi:hypothetical protein
MQAGFTLDKPQSEEPFQGDVPVFNGTMIDSRIETNRLTENQQIAGMPHARTHHD